MLKNCLFPGFVYFEASVGCARTFCREKVFCKLRVSSERRTVELVQLVVRGISQSLLQAGLDGTVYLYAEQF